MVSMWGEPELNYKVNQKFAERVKAMSNGRIQIETFSSGSIMPYTEYFDAIRSGVVDLVQAGGTYWAGKDPALAAVDLASIFIGDYPRMLTWMWGHGGINLAREAYAKWDLFYIGHHMYTYAGESIVAKKPIKTFDDIKGFKMRAPETMAPVWKEMGANVLTIPGAEVYTALNTGLIDGADWSSPAANFRLKFHEVAPYYSRPGDYYMGGTGEFTMRMDKWNALPDDLKALLEEEAKVQAFDMWIQTSYDDLTSVGKLTAAGAKMFTWDAEVTKKVKQLISDVNRDLALKSEGGKKIYNNIQDYLKLIGG
jgi:TRAP-type mannitol/chloroaromatic compound transport system substrate-binding protein